MRVRTVVVVLLGTVAACAPQSARDAAPPAGTPAGTPASTPGEPLPPAIEVPAPSPPTAEPPRGPGTGLTLDLDAALALPPLQRELPVYELEIPEVVLQAFAQDLYAPEQSATFRSAGRSWPVMVQLRGASARTFPKKSWNVDFGRGVVFDGRRRLNLIAEYQDCTLMVEKLAYDLLAAVGVKAPRATFVRVVVNGRQQGVYLDLEQVDKSFLDAHGFTDLDASIWRCGWKDCEFMTRAAKHELRLLGADGGYQGDWALKTNETEPRAPLDDALERVLHLMNHAPDPTLPAALASRFALEPYLRALAVDALVSNNFVEDSESYFIHDRAEDRWFYVPWDLNNADPRYWPTYPIDHQPGVRHQMVGFTLLDSTVASRYANRLPLGYPNYLPVFSNLALRVALHPELRERLLAVLERALDEPFTTATLGARIDAMYALVSPAMHAPVDAVPVSGAPADFIDPHVDLAKFDRGPSYLKTYVAGRIAFLRSEIARIRGWKPTLAIEALDAQAGWIEVRNRGTAAVDLGGRTLTSQLRKPTLRNLPASALAPGQRMRFSAAELGITLGEDGELGLFDGRSVVGIHDAVFYGKLPPGQRYQRSESGPWEIR